jgi:hypothetical protein
MKVTFEDLFISHTDGTFTPRSTIRFGNTTLGPETAFLPGVRFSDIDIAQFRGRNIEITELEDGGVDIKAIY